ncbi:MAG: DUF5056 domain-containing protein [Bacteroidales bacterium]|jgi:hypothetical protein|nr:DUF5056 domain-containing protein [Bacteroidales bacterium]
MKDNISLLFKKNKIQIEDGGFSENVIEQLPPRRPYIVYVLYNLIIVFGGLLIFKAYPFFNFNFAAIADFFITSSNKANVALQDLSLQIINIISNVRILVALFMGMMIFAFYSAYKLKTE